MARGGKKGFTGGPGVLWGLLGLGLLVPQWQALAWIGGIGLLIGWLARNKTSSPEAPPAELPVGTVLPAASRTLSSPSISRPPATPAGRAMSRADEDTLTVTVTIGTGPAASGYRIPPPAPMSAPALLSRDGARFWKPAGETAFVKGQRLDGGLLYVGTGLGAVSGEQVEAALIDPALPVDRHFRDFRQRELGYWSSYSLASERGRAAYLAWLADGRQAPGADIGYVFLYFYGLERRVLCDATVDPAAAAERPLIRAELVRLLGRYGGNHSLHNYASSLLAWIDAEALLTAPLAEVPPALAPSFEIPLALRIGIGRHARDARPLPAAWALAWLQAVPGAPLRTPAKRCPQAFATLFADEYQQRFGDGLRLKPNQTRIVVTHRPASPSFAHDRLLERKLDLPDPTVLQSQYNKLADLALSCQARLDGYSRYIGRHPARSDALDALIELPGRLWPETVRRRLDTVRDSIHRTGSPVTLPFAKLREWLPTWHEPTRARYQSLAGRLGELGLGIEPDPRFGGGLPADEQPVVLFGLPAEAPATPGARYGVAALGLQLAVAVAQADGTADAGERALLIGQIEDWLELPPAERARLQARLRLLIAVPPTLTGLKKRIEAVSPALRDAIGELLAAVALADGHASAAEVKLLERIYRMLGLEAQTLYARLHRQSGSPTNAPASPATPSMGSAAPASAPPPPVSGFTLDRTRLASLLADTERAANLLGDIFAERTEPTESAPVAEPAPVTEAPEPPAAAPAPLLTGLDAAHDALLRCLLARTHWPRAELEELCADRGLMTDGALERLNEAAFEQHDQPLLEGDEPLEINPELCRALHAHLEETCA